MRNSGLLLPKLASGAVMLPSFPSSLVRPSTQSRSVRPCSRAPLFCARRMYSWIETCEGQVTSQSLQPEQRSSPAVTVASCGERYRSDSGPRNFGPRKMSVERATGQTVLHDVHLVQASTECSSSTVSENVSSSSVIMQPSPPARLDTRLRSPSHLAP